MRTSLEGLAQRDPRFAESQALVMGANALRS
jgi:hypothetical protein